MSKILESTSKLLSGGIVELTSVFVVVAIIGIFITMAGYRKLGTKMSSLSFLLYILLRVVFK